MKGSAAVWPCTPSRHILKRSYMKAKKALRRPFSVTVEPAFVKWYRKALVNRGFAKKPDTRLDTHCIKTGVRLWCERGDLPAFFRRGDIASDRGWSCAKKSMYSPVCALVNTQPTGLCGHDSSLPYTKKRTTCSGGSFLVRERRLELPRRLTHAPQTCLSTCSSTLAYKRRCFDCI